MNISARGNGGWYQLGNTGYGNGYWYKTDNGYGNGYDDRYGHGHGAGHSRIGTYTGDGHGEKQ